MSYNHSIPLHGTDSDSAAQIQNNRNASSTPQHRFEDGDQINISDSKAATLAFTETFLRPCLSAFGATFGLASLVLSSVMARAGPMVFMGSMVLAMFINYVSFMVLLRIGERHRLSNFIQIADLLESSVTRFAFKMIYLAINFGILLSGSIVFNSLVSQIFRQSGATYALLAGQNSYFWVVALHILTLPLLMKRRLSELGFITTLTLFACFYITGFLVVSAITSPTTVDSLVTVSSIFNWTEIPRCYSIIFFVFSLQINLFSLYYELPRPSIDSLRPVLLTNFSFLAFIYLAMAVSGIICFASKIDSLIENEIILRMFDNSNKAVLVASCLMVVTSLNTFLYTFKPTKDIILAFLSDEREQAGLAAPQAVAESAKGKSLNVIVTLGLTLVSLATSTCIVVFKISFVRIIDILADALMPVLFVFVPLAMYSQGKKSWAVAVALAVAGFFYLSYFLLQFTKGH